MNHLSAKLFSVAAGALVLFVIAVAPASAAQGEYHWGFTQDKQYFDQTDRNGRFTAQATNDWVVTMAWSFQISPAVQAIATSTMNCRAGHNQLPYSDAHDNIPVDYLWHSSVPGNKRDNANYDLWGNCTFKVNAGGRPGTANLSFKFHYYMFCGPCGPQPTSREEAAGGSPMTSEVDITYDQ